VSPISKGCSTQYDPLKLQSDRYGFQAANIVATIQLVRMVLWSSGGGSIEERCKIASEVVDAFMSIPGGYLQAISSPLLHHLAGIGAVLGGVFEERLSESAYHQVRTVLLSLAQLLENLDHGIHSSTSAQRLRDLVSQIDQHMASQMARTAIEAPDTMNSESPANMLTSSVHLLRSPEFELLPMQFSMPFLQDWSWNFDFVQDSGG